jgi:hypothetical protein
MTDDSARMTKAFERCFTRGPNSRELNRLLEYLQSQRTEYASQPEAAAALSPMPEVPGVAPAEGAAWTMVSRVLMNLDEFITRE